MEMFIVSVGEPKGKSSMIEKKMFLVQAFSMEEAVLKLFTTNNEELAEGEPLFPVHYRAYAEPVEFTNGVLAL